MTDDHETLRAAMADLSEHGGNADLYDRAVTKSRRTRRRTTALTAGGAAVVVLGLTAGIVTTAGGRAPDTVVATTPSVTVPASPAVPSRPAPSPTAPSPTAPSPTAPSSAAPSIKPTGKPSSVAPKSDGCPVRKSALQRISELPDGYRLTGVECWHGWASAGVIAPSPELQGDGLILFRYRDGGWRRHSEGSGYFCSDLGITKIPGDPPPFCTFNE